MADGEEDNRISAFIELTGADTDEVWLAPSHLTTSTHHGTFVTDRATGS